MYVCRSVYFSNITQEFLMCGHGGKPLTRGKVGDQVVLTVASGQRDFGSCGWTC